jgi:dTDP-4-amino-4,6-dideoxy-D-galactose acyltransferase
MKQTLQKLDWDSAFFNFNVGRINGLIQNEEDITDVDSLIIKNDMHLSYYSTTKELPSSINTSVNFDIVLVDKKTTYAKKIISGLSFHESITSVDENTPFKNKLIDLAIQSGVYSRFNVDERIGKEKFEEMYALWMINSLNRQIAKEVLVVSENNDLSGFVTLGEKNNRADIGIIAVDHISRGKGMGKTLMTSAEKWSSDLGYETIQVVTQGDNFPACRLYESCGYKVDSVEFFYHIWRK